VNRGYANWRRIIILPGLFIALAGLSTCEEEEEVLPTDFYYGHLTTHRVSLMETRTDSISLVLEQTRYSFTHYSRLTNLCDSDGNLNPTGRSVLLFVPTAFEFDNCDTVRVPHGEFAAVFRGDSLYLTQDATDDHDITYDIKLKK